MFNDPTQFRPRVQEEIPDEPDPAEAEADRVDRLLDGDRPPESPEPEAVPEPASGDEA